MTDLLHTQLQETLGETYALERELGGGGMSRVFVAHEAALGRRVVVKVLPPELAAEVSNERFRREIQLAAQLQHPHIVPLLSAGETRGLPFFTMPYVEGESLRARLTRGGELPVAQAIRILREVASALAHAHDRGVAHRDIKPDNVMLAGGSAMVTDFGVAKALSVAQRVHDVGEAGVLTSHGIALGTPAYMAPEQAAADPAMDHRVDIYAFGILAYELLTGQPPFAGRAPQALLAAHVTETPEPIVRRRPALPPALATLVMRCLEKRAADRPQSATELMHLLDAVATPSGGLTPADGMRPHRIPPRVRNALVTVAVTAAAVVAAVGVYQSVGTSRAVVSAQRVHVAPFVNRTLSPDLAEIGPMTADVLTSGLAETGLVEVVQDSATAGTFVRGTVYRRGDTLQLVAQVTEARTGRVLRSIGPISAVGSDPLVGLETLRERVTGSVAALLDPVLGGIATVTSAPPSFAAYRELRDGREAESELDHAGAIAHYLSAAAEAEGYTFPLVAAAESYARLGECSAADSLGATLLADRARLTPYEAYSLDETLAACRGAREAAYRAATRKLELVPTSPIARYGVAAAALEVGRYDEAVELLAALEEDPAAAALRNRADFVATHGRALHATGAHVEELALARRLRQRAPDLREAVNIELRALAALGRAGDVRRVIDELGAGDATALMEVAADELLAHNHDRDARQLAVRLVAWYGDQARETNGRSLAALGALARAYYAAGQWQDARQLADSLVQVYPSSASLLALKGRIAARQGDRSAAAMVSAVLEGLGVPGPEAGATPHALLRARIATLLGEREAAMRLLAASVAQGESELLRLREDPDLATLRGYAPFDRLTGG